MTIAQTKKWSDFHVNKAGANYPKWPNEPMFKTLFGKPVTPATSWRVLDVSRGSGKDMVLFADRGCERHGVEIEHGICTMDLITHAKRATVQKRSWGKAVICRIPTSALICYA
jgi:hypothetical protein